MLQNNRKHSLALCDSIWGEKQFLLIFVTLYWIDQKQLFKQIQIFPGFSPFKHGKTNKLSEYFSALFWDSHFCLKREVLSEFPQKCFKTREKHSLSVCYSIIGENQFLLLFVTFYWFDQKHLFKQIQIFLRICPIQTW